MPFVMSKQLSPARLVFLNFILYVMYVCMHACMQVCMHACMCVCMYMYACISACMYVQCMHACIYTYFKKGCFSDGMFRRPQCIMLAKFMAAFL